MIIFSNLLKINKRRISKKQWEGEEKRNVYIRYQDLDGNLWPFTNIHTDNNYPVQAKFIIKLKSSK